jgi:hypothetical protein
MHKRTQDLITYGELCGFHLAGSDGNQHFVMEHPNGERVRIASTPGDYRGDDNNRALMRRLSGVTPDVGRRAGKFRKGVRLETFEPANERVESVSAQFARLEGMHRKACALIDRAESPEEARPHVQDLVFVESLIKELGRPVPPRSFRMKGVS